MAPTTKLYQSPPGSGGNDGALPSSYDQRWWSYTNLTPQQILAFQAFPQDLQKYIVLLRWQHEVRQLPGNAANYITLPDGMGAISGIQLLTDVVSQQKIAAVKQAIDNGTLVIVGATFPFLAVNGVFLLSAADITALYGCVVRHVQATYTTAADLLGQVNAKTLTTHAAVDAAFASIQVV